MMARVKTRAVHARAGMAHPAALPCTIVHPGVLDGEPVGINGCAGLVMQAQRVAAIEAVLALGAQLSTAKTPVHS
jgi:hypothetical protein